jgi:hypothetical protein
LLRRASAGEGRVRAGRKGGGEGQWEKGEGTGEKEKENYKKDQENVEKEKEKGEKEKERQRKEGEEVFHTTAGEGTCMEETARGETWLAMWQSTTPSVREAGRSSPRDTWGGGWRGVEGGG